MSMHLARDLEKLERDILAQASMVEEMIQKACLAIREVRGAPVTEVMGYERQVDDNEVRIEEDCLKILALHQPVAVDLRRTTTIMKINNDLERIADLAVNVAERAQRFCENPSVAVPQSFARMAEVAVEMVRSALDAFVALDSQAARNVRTRDDEVDDLNRQVISEMQQVMRSQPDQVECALYLFSASRYVERIADHATNIAEDVIYLVDGEIARHKPEFDPTVQPS